MRIGVLIGVTVTSLLAFGGWFGAFSPKTVTLTTVSSQTFVTASQMV